MEAKSADGHEWKVGDRVSLPLEGEELENEQICENGLARNRRVREHL